MKRFNIVTKTTFPGKNGDKNQWHNVGTLIQFEATSEKDESYILELSMFPETKCYVFEAKKKEAPQERSGFAEQPPAGEEDIPF